MADDNALDPSANEKHLDALYEVALASSGELNPAVLGRLVVDRARELFDGNEATLLWYDPKVDALCIVADTFARSFPRPVKVGEGTAGMAYQTGEPVVIDDYQNWEQAVPEAVSRGIVAVVAIPLMVRNRPVGAFTVSFNQPRRFTPAEMRVMSLFATQVAPALEAARLHDELVHMTQELERASAAKSRFLANMSHELRTPLNAIIGFSELLIDAHAGTFDEARRMQFLQRIHGSGTHLLALINDILDLSKVEAGQMELMPATFGLAPAVNVVVDTVRPLADRKSIALETHLDEVGDIKADEGKVRQMLLNLLSNAIKFTPEGGRVTVRVDRSPSEVTLSVEDTGIGISAEDQATLFVEFHQLTKPGKPTQEGTGLGLALVKRLAELHGGRVWVESEVDKGSRFYIALPAGAPAVVQPRDGGAPPTVLVVEDNENAAMLLTVALERAGYEVEVVRKGAEAVERATQLRPMAITLDILLPDADGWDVLRSLKAAAATRDIPVMVITGVDDRALGLGIGADDYMVKPVKRDALLSFLGRHGGLRPPDERMTVLAVDDDPAALELVKENLEPRFTVITSADGRHALDVARRQAPDLVILDLMMPGMNGFEVAAALKADEATRAIPIVVLTAKDMTEDDKVRLNGNVASVVKKGGEATAVLVEWIRTRGRPPQAGTPAPTR